MFFKSSVLEVKKIFFITCKLVRLYYAVKYWLFLYCPSETCSELQYFVMGESSVKSNRFNVHPSSRLILLPQDIFTVGYPALYWETLYLREWWFSYARVGISWMKASKLLRKFLSFSSGYNCYHHNTSAVTSLWLKNQ